MIFIIIILLLGFIARLFTVKISKTNEERLKKAGAVEYGINNSKILILLHILFYLSVLIEAIVRKPHIDGLAIAGIVIYIFSLTMLFYVISQLREVWTVKVFISQNHILNKSLLFKYVKHPNYFLNIIPELVSLILICKAYFAGIVIFPVYLVTLFMRIRIEESAMKVKFANYWLPGINNFIQRLARGAGTRALYLSDGIYTLIFSGGLKNDSGGDDIQSNYPQNLKIIRHQFTEKIKLTGQYKQ